MMDITLNHQTDQSITFTYYESDGVTARSLTGATVYFTVKANVFSKIADDTDALIKKDVTDHTDAADGITSIALTNSDTDILPSANYYYDIKVKEADNKVYLAQSGRCTISASPTNRA